MLKEVIRDSVRWENIIAISGIYTSAILPKERSLKIFLSIMRGQFLAEKMRRSDRQDRVMGNEKINTGISMQFTPILRLPLWPWSQIAMVGSCPTMTLRRESLEHIEIDECLETKFQPRHHTKRSYNRFFGRQGSQCSLVQDITLAPLSS